MMNTFHTITETALETAWKHKIPQNRVDCCLESLKPVIPQYIEGGSIEYLVASNFTKRSDWFKICFV